MFLDITGLFKDRDDIRSRLTGLWLLLVAQKTLDLIHTAVYILSICGLGDDCINYFLINSRSKGIVFWVLSIRATNIPSFSFLR